jgi:uncharacterized membrane protein
LSSDNPFVLGKGRLESLTDGIFATVMTVLVLSLSIPTIINANNSVVTSYVLGLGPIIISYVLSFLILGVFWYRHHIMFHFIERIDNTLLWLNMLFLLTIGFVPFSTELIGRFWTEEISTIIYGSNLIATGVTMQGIWQYAVRKNLVVPDVINERIMSNVNRFLSGGPILYLLAVLISFLVPRIGTEIALVVYMIVLVYYVLVSSIARLGILRRLVSTRSKQK